ncbi:MAG: phytanoyl-CoA dioxygenase family protein [Granulosicoccus sp.]|nr:phytanoyl-CoA dioxygenase family protein [Granulosicoccus sp.]
MGNVLSKQQIEQFHELGFVSPVDVMSASEAADYRQKLEAAEKKFPDAIHAENRNNAHLAFPFLDEIVHHPIIVGAVEDLIGPDIALWGTVLFIKEANSPGYVSWHQDGTYMGMNNNNFVTPWLALTPSNLQNGCMSMIPRSHKKHIFPHEDTFDEDNILTRGQVVTDVDASRSVELVLEPGQMSLHHGEIIHGSQPNLSNERRIGFAMQSYMSPDIQQVIGKNLWLPIQGDNTRNGSVALSRPQSEMDSIGVANRELVNQNYADILYHGAKQRRSY